MYTEQRALDYRRHQYGNPVSRYEVFAEDNPMSRNQTIAALAVGGLFVGGLVALTVVMVQRRKAEQAAAAAADATAPKTNPYHRVAAPFGRAA